MNEHQRSMSENALALVTQMQNEIKHQAAIINAIKYWAQDNCDGAIGANDWAKAANRVSQILHDHGVV